MLKNEITILSTKLIGDDWVTLAAEKKIQIETIAFIQTEPIITDELSEQIKNLSKASATVVFTSSKAVAAVIGLLKGVVPDWKFFCVGQQTKNFIEQYFGIHSVECVARNAAELAQNILREMPALPILFFCGDRRRGELPGILKQNNTDLVEIIVYKTSATPRTIEKKYDGIIFFSPSAVGSFFQSNSLQNDAVLFAFGKTTAEEIRKYSNNKIITSAEPGMNLLMEQLISYFEANPVQQ